MAGDDLNPWFPRGGGVAAHGTLAGRDGEARDPLERDEARSPFRRAYGMERPLFSDFRRSRAAHSKESGST